VRRTATSLGQARQTHERGDGFGPAFTERSRVVFMLPQHDVGPAVLSCWLRGLDSAELPLQPGLHRFLLHTLVLLGQGHHCSFFFSFGEVGGVDFH